MPELPEVETIVRTLSPQILGTRINNINVLLTRSLEFGQEHLNKVKGLFIQKVRRRGKLILWELSDNMQASAPLFYIAFHLKMTGSFFVHPANSAPLKHTRIIFDLATAPDHPQSASTTTSSNTVRLFFDDIRTFGYCRIMLPEEFTLWPFLQGLGPEPLETPTAALATLFKDSKSAIKAVLLNQQIVAGIGNIYADEALFQAGILPTAKAASISLPRLEKLAEAIQAILLKSIAECGSSIRNYKDALGQAGAFQNSFSVYGKGGQPCSHCNTELVAARIAGRGTVYCPICQKN